MNKKKIKFNRIGKILSGDYKSWYIFIEDDSSRGGGYTVYLTKKINDSSSDEGYDEWYSDLDELHINLAAHYPEVNWNI